MSVTKEEYQVIKEIILAHSTYTWCNGHCIPLANTNAVMQSLDNIFADGLGVDREAFREYIKPAIKQDTEISKQEKPKEENIKKRHWWHI